MAKKYKRWDGKPGSVPMEPLEVEWKTPEDLYTWAKEVLGFEKDKARQILKSAGFDTFSATSWWTYVSVLKMYSVDEIAKTEYPIDGCPICKAPVKRNSARDNMFGVKWAWACTEDRFHFIYHRVKMLYEIPDKNDNEQHAAAGLEDIASVPAS